MEDNTRGFDMVQTDHSLASPMGYPEIFWNIFNGNQIAVAVSNPHGHILFCNQSFQHRIILSFGIDLRQYAEATEILLDKSPSLIRLIRMAYLDMEGNAVYIWFAFVEADQQRVSPLLIVEHLQRVPAFNINEIVFRTTVSDKLVFFNKLFIERFGLNSFQITKGFTATDLFDSEESYDFFKHKVLNEKLIQEETICLRTLNGEKLIGLMNCHVYYNENNEPLLNWSILDISEQKAYEEKLLEKNEQLAKVNGQMEKFLYSTSHDLRAPLTSILGLVNLVKMESIDKNITEYISRIEASTLRLDKIIRDIMSFSKTTYQQMKYEPIDFEKITWKTINAYQQDPNFKALSFEVNVSVEGTFCSDIERLEIVFDNLIRNCIHFMDNNKVKPIVRVNVVADSTQAVVEIIDNGVGIARHNLEQIFHMFYKASLLSRGAGLGLCIVKEGLEQLHGTIKVDSEIGFGSIFKLHIPNECNHHVTPNASPRME